MLRRHRRTVNRSLLATALAGFALAAACSSNTSTVGGVNDGVESGGAAGSTSAGTGAGASAGTAGSGTSGSSGGSGGATAGAGGTSGGTGGTAGGTGGASGGVGGSGSGCPADVAAAQGQPCSQEGLTCDGVKCVAPPISCANGEWVPADQAPDPDCNKAEGETCGSDVECQSGLKCCYPCGQPGCDDECSSMLDNNGDCMPPP